MTSSRAPAIGMAVLLSLLVCLLLPATAYLGNLAEFATPPGALARLLSGPAALACAVLLLVVRLTPPRRTGLIATALAALILLAWAQAYLIAWDYGVLDGSPIAWDTPRWRAADGLLWIAGLAAALRWHRRLEKPLVTAASVVFVLQLGLLAQAAWQLREPLQAKAQRPAAEDPSALPRFSPERNVLHLVLDSFQADVFQELAQEPGSPLGTRLSGFTFFEEHLGTFPATYLAMPVIVSGQVYLNHMPQARFMESVYGGRSVLNAAKDAGYEVDIASSVSLVMGLLMKGRFDHAFHVDRPAAPRDAASLLDLALFRMAPHALKHAVYGDQRWLVQRLLEPSPQAAFGYFRENAFLSYMARELRTDRAAPVYKFVHLMTTHAPFVVNPDCSFAGGVVPRDRLTVTVQSRCSLAHVLALFESMKAAGIYDRTLIVLMGDHGGHVPPYRYAPGTIEHNGQEFALRPDLVALATPLLAIKPIGATGPLQTSRALTSMTDVAATVDLLAGIGGGLPGRSVFEATTDPTVPRRFHPQLWSKKDPQSEYIERIDEVTVTGSAYDVRSWQVGPSHAPPHR